MDKQSADQAKTLSSSGKQSASIQAVAERIALRLGHVRDKLGRREHQELHESLTRLEAYAKLLQATDRKQFLQDELAKAAEQVQQVERRLARQQQTDRQQDKGVSFGM